MKKIGLIGGTGWVSSLEYYKQINQKVNLRAGGLNFPELVLHSLNYGQFKLLDEKHKLDFLIQSISALELHKIDGIVLCANTLHQYIPDLSLHCQKPFIHIAEATSTFIKDLKINHVGLLGTKFTMEMPFYIETLNEHGISVIVPDAADREFIHSSIQNELLINIFHESTRQRFYAIINQLVQRGAKAIVLGCTEIPLLLHQEDIEIQLINTLEIHTNAITEFIMDEK